MRLIVLAAAAALCAAAPAAAQQPDADSIAMGAIEQITANHGDVRDYTLVLAHGAVRAPVYVHRRGGEWRVEAPSDPPLAEMLSAAVIWPVMLSEMTGKTEDDKVEDLSQASGGYLGTETVGGRRAHVLFARFDGDGELPDSIGMYVDVETRQLLRLDATGVTPEGALPGGGDLRMSIDLAGYAEHDGLTIPMRMRVRMQGDIGLSSKERQKMREELPEVRARLQAMEGAEREQGLATLALFEGLLLGGELDMEVTVAEVRVNSGPPRWMKELDAP